MGKLVSIILISSEKRCCGSYVVSMGFNKIESRVIQELTMVMVVIIW